MEVMCYKLKCSMCSLYLPQDGSFTAYAKPLTSVQYVVRNPRDGYQCCQDGRDHPMAHTIRLGRYCS